MMDVFPPPRRSALASARAFGRAARIKVMISRGEFERALRAIDQIVDRADDPRLYPSITDELLLLAGSIHLTQGHPDEALRYARRRVEFGRQIGYDTVVAGGLGQEAEVLAAQGRFTEAVDAYRRGLLALDALTDDSPEALLHDVPPGALDPARREQLLAIRRRRREAHRRKGRHTRGLLLSELGSALAMAGAYDAAAEAHTEAYAVAEEEGRDDLAASYASQIILVYLGLAQPERA
jgi:tetratricopeptide (TPR) repeat protein